MVRDQWGEGMELLSIGKLAQAAGVSVETIRYYQRRGLLDQPTKPLGGNRSYTSKHIKRVRFIKRTQALGFTLAEVNTLLALDSIGLCGDTRDMVLQKSALIDRKIAELTSLRDVLDGLAQQCGSEKPDSTCPIIDVLAEDIQ